jgi:hypothetical protein
MFGFLVQEWTLVSKDSLQPANINFRKMGFNQVMGFFNKVSQHLIPLGGVQMAAMFQPFRKVFWFQIHSFDHQIEPFETSIVLAVESEQDRQ